MNILLIDCWNHNKNENALQLYKNINFHKIKLSELNSIDISQYDGLYSPSEPIDVSKYPSLKCVFGPHFSVFPNENLHKIISDNSSYIVLSKWNKNIWKKFPICKNLKLVDIPFAVDTERFIETIPIQNRDKVFIYYKGRNPMDLEFIERLCKLRDIEYKIFNYVKKYNEKDYLEYLQQSKYGIWIGRHESQGFALQEALSCNVPLFVWCVSSMNQEYMQNYSNIPATTIPYWDERCGEYFYNKGDFSEMFDLFLEKLYTYKPREYVLENLSSSVCEKRFMKLFTPFLI
jgi:hypothetical protein